MGRKFSLCVRDRGRKKERKCLPKATNACVGVHMLMHIHTHTHTGKAAVPRFSNLILVEMRLEMSCGGRAGDEERFKLQDPETDCFIIHLQQYLSTHTHAWSCNLLSHSDILLLFHSISPVLRHTRLLGDVSAMWACCNKYGQKCKERSCERKLTRRIATDFETVQRVSWCKLLGKKNSVSSSGINPFRELWICFPVFYVSISVSEMFVPTTIQWFQCSEHHKHNSINLYYIVWGR